jgi:ABC-type branched-subunit amino acid transport system substrate-binding protein
MALSAVMALAAGSMSLSAVGAQEDETPAATEIGVTDTTIHIGIIADVDNAARPGLFQGAVDGMEGFVKYINKKGGLAGRDLELDFIDSHLSPDEARTALITACEEDFAIVGSSALFLNNVDPMVNCVDQAGVATGLPDVPILQTEFEHQCSPVSFPIITGQLDCATKDDHPQTYGTRQGAVKYHLKQNDDDLSGVWLIPSDLQATVNATLPIIAGAQKAGVEEVDEIQVSALAQQSEYTPFVQTIKSDNATYALSGLDYKSTVSLRREANIQGVTSVKVWDCTLQCYDPKLIEEGGDDVEGQFSSIFFIPVEEAKQNAGVNAFVKNTGKSKATGFAEQAFTAGLFFRDVVNAIVAADGNNGLTRARFLEEAANQHDFTAEVDGDAMIGPTDVGGHKVSGCFVLMQVKDGEFVRVFPKAKNTLNCDKKNVVKVELDLT